VTRQALCRPGLLPRQQIEGMRKRLDRLKNL